MMTIKEATEAMTRVFLKAGISIGKWSEMHERTRQEIFMRAHRVSLTAKAFGISIKEASEIELDCVIHHMLSPDRLNEIDDVTWIDTIYFAYTYGAPCQDYYERIGSLVDKGWGLLDAMSRYRVDMAELIYGEEAKE